MNVACSNCGHVWEIPNEKDYKLTIRASEVNKEGPFCGLCRTLEEAIRFATHRRWTTGAQKLKALRNSIAL
jgi:hypothetical protein